MAITITIRESNRNGRVTTRRCRTEDRAEALNRTLRAAYGPRAGFAENQELNSGISNDTRYGQVVYPSTQRGVLNGGPCVRVDFE